jgi:hypothetical protein
MRQFVTLFIACAMLCGCNTSQSTEQTEQRPTVPNAGSPATPKIDDNARVLREFEERRQAEQADLARKLKERLATLQGELKTAQEAQNIAKQKAKDAYAAFELAAEEEDKAHNNYHSLRARYARTIGAGAKNQEQAQQNTVGAAYDEAN